MVRAMGVEPRATHPVEAPPAASLVELLTVAQRRVARGVSAVLAEDGATLDGYRVMRCLAAGPGRSMSDLGAALSLPAPTLTRLVDGLVDAAEAYRLPDPADGRRVRVHLSSRGRTHLSRLEALVRAQEAALSRAWDPERVGELVRALAALEGGD
jgi:DNA-binding MarR family transcriptional regulator